MNTLHVVLRLLANPDEEAKARVVLLAAGAVRRAHKDDIHNVRSVDGVRNFYIKMSSWGFMQDIKGTLMPLDDLAGLSRLEMAMSFPLP